MLRQVTTFLRQLLPFNATRKVTMEILRDNFEEELPKILKAIDEADFIAFDYEFTGLFTEKDQGLVDTHEERYVRHRRQCVKFLPIQAGICTFKYDHDEKKYSYAPYSIFLFPHGSEGLSKTPKVYSMQASSIDFLVKHQFDFNKAFYHGVGFGTVEELQSRKDHINTKYDNYLDELEKFEEPCMSLPDDKKDVVEEKVNLVQKFLADPSKVDEELVLSNLNGFERKLLYTYLPLKVSKTPHTFTIESRYSPEDGPQMVIRANKEGLEGKRNAIIQRREEALKNTEMMMGFSKLVRAISKSNAVVIGHNQGIDLMQTLHHCVAPLPESYSAYKEYVTTIFPRLVDTKYLAAKLFSDIISCNGLGNLYQATRSEPFRSLELEPPNSETDLQNSAKFHDASFDAFITGCSFLSMLDYLANKAKLENPVENVKKLIKKHYHRIPIMDCIGVTHMNLAGDDEAVQRDRAFVANFPAEWRTSHLRDAFKSVIQDPMRLAINWQNDVTAWVCLDSEVDPDKVEKLSDPKMGFRVTAYANFVKDEDMDLDSSEPTPKRLKVENGSRKRTSRADNTENSSVFQIPNDW